MAVDLHCWRCRAFVPMLTEPEGVLMAPVLQGVTESIRRYRAVHELGLPAALLPELDQPALDLYRALTGATGIPAEAIRHHRLSLRGPPCRACGKPLRTPRASFCAACGTAVRPLAPGANLWRRPKLAFAITPQPELGLQQRYPAGPSTHTSTRRLRERPWSVRLSATGRA